MLPNLISCYICDFTKLKPGQTFVDYSIKLDMHDLYNGAWLDQRFFHAYTMAGSETKCVNTTPLISDCKATPCLEMLRNSKPVT